MLSDKQRRTALKKNIAHARDMARRLLADGVEEITLAMLAHGLDLKVQVLNAEEYFTWLGTRPPTYQTLEEYPGGKHVSGNEAKVLLGID